MFKVKTLTVKNFMSVGNSTQAINFDRKDLVLVLGENLDLGGDDTGARNGTGKTSIINALSYGLYGQALTNIKKDNLINKTNSKGMLVTVEFDFNSQSYKIERGRKPNTLKFYINNIEQAITDESQGDSRETQAEIEKMLGMSHDMFKYVLALNTYTEPFLSLGAGGQRVIIEQLLGITLLSEKADSLKELVRGTKDAVSAEDVRIKAVQEANKRMLEQIESVKRRQSLWIKKHNEDIAALTQSITDLEHIDIDAEIAAHRALVAYNQTKKDLQDLQAAALRAKQDRDREDKIIAKLKKEIESLSKHECHACGQAFHDDRQEQTLVTKRRELEEATANLTAHIESVSTIDGAVVEIGALGRAPKVFYDNESDALKHQASIASLRTQLTAKQAEVDPYADQIVEMSEQAIVEISYDDMNELVRLQEHQEFLLKLLTNKDSFIRKKIIEQNLTYLNSRLSFYLEKMGLPHQVKFLNDLNVEITELGRDLDFDNLSRGERNRLILSLSWAFRDVWESLYQPINLLFVDELIDNGLDASGVENAMGVLKKMSRDRQKSIWLVSHRDELSSRVSSILHVVKENGFTSYNTDVETL